MHTELPYSDGTVALKTSSDGCFSQRISTACTSDGYSTSEDENVLKQLKYFISIRKIPNLIFHGSSGTGKRTIVGNFINQIYEGDRARIKTNVMFVNCAHGKGIKFIRDELKYFAKANMQCNDNNMFKSIVLMNADELTIDAQSALRRCIELFSHNTRFFIIVENKYKLLNPILSRFCEIYIPDKTTISGAHQLKYTSMHQTCVENTYGMENIKHETRCAIFDPELKPIMLEFLDGKEITKDPAWFVGYSNRLYEEGVSCLDLIKYLEDDLGVETAIKKKMTITLNFCFNKVKNEYRCEKMALFYLFDYLFFRSNKSLKNISFI